MKLSILICSLKSRETQLHELFCELTKQICSNKYWFLSIEILIDQDEGQKRIGAKRNDLMQRAQGDYVAFIDDDDMVSANYISTLMAGIETNPDCISLRGQMTTDGRKVEMFEHSIKYKTWATKIAHGIRYERTVNHLNCIRRDIAIQFKFPPVNFSEDHQWSKQLQASGLLQKEYYTDRLLYYYKFVSKKTP